MSDAVEAIPSATLDIIERALQWCDYMPMVDGVYGIETELREALSALRAVRGERSLGDEE